MLDHMSIPVSDFDHSLAFYDAALQPLGCGRVMEFEGNGYRSAGYGAENKPYFWIGSSGSGAVAVAPQEGFHVAFSAPSRAAVAAFHEASMDAGAIDNGPPGIRAHYHPSYYAAFVIDPDGYHIEAVCHRPE